MEILFYNIINSEHFNEVGSLCRKTVIKPDMTKDIVSLAITLIEIDMEPTQHILETVAPVCSLMKVYRKPTTE